MLAQPEGEQTKKFLMVNRRSIKSSKINYECIIYNSANSTVLQSLESVTSEAIEITSGRCKTTPKISLQVTTEEPPL